MKKENISTNVRGGGATLLNKDAYNNENKKRAVKVFLLLLFIVLLVGISYGYVSKIINGSKQSKITAGILDLELFEGEEVVIENLYPQANEVGLIQEESFDFKLINKTENPTNYMLKLQRVETPDELALTDVVYGLTKDNVSSTNLLSELEDGNYIIDEGTIKGNQTINYELRFWLREDIEDDTTTNSKTLVYKLNAEVSQKIEKIKITLAGQKFEVEESTDTFPDFYAISSRTNGRGIYKYTEDGEDIYYWRGKVDNNHVIFAGFCWEMVRTTKTGGIKMIYDGIPTSEGYCTNTGDATHIGKSKFNPTSNKHSYVGYMYGKVYTYTTTTDEQEKGKYVYGNDIEYDKETSKYKLVDTITTTGVWTDDYLNISKGHHYTCFNETGECDIAYYFELIGKNDGQYMILENGDYVKDVLSAINANITDSEVKKVIDEWYRINIEEKGYSDSIEDAIYCNDRRLSSSRWDKDTTIATGGYQYFASAGRLNIGWDNKKPDLSCDLNDSFTKYNENGNGSLKYPIGLITGDEIKLAGGGGFNAATENKDYYLYTGTTYWAMTPYYIYLDLTGEYSVHASGMYGNGYTGESKGVRPVLSLSKTVEFSSSNGTETDPYIVK